MLAERQAYLTASPSTALRGLCSVPGDKSVSHRAIILAAMAPGRSIVTGHADGQDVRAMIRAVETFGATVSASADGLAIDGGPWSSPIAPIDCGNSGTAARLLIGAVAGMAGVNARFVGDESLSRRPMDRVIDPLRRMGANIFNEGTGLPVDVVGASLQATTHRNLPASAQVKSALLLAGLNARGMQWVVEPQPTRDHLEILLAEFGCGLVGAAIGGNHSVGLNGPATLRPTQIALAGDPSSAAFAIVAGLIVPGSEVGVSDVLLNPGRTGLLDVLAMMGADIDVRTCGRRSGELVGTIECRSGPLRAADVPASTAPRMIDEYPIAAVAAAYARGTSIFRGLGELRHKESDRLERLVTGLAACGVEASLNGDDLIVTGCPSPQGDALIDSHGDHRIAMAFAVLALNARHPIRISGSDMIATSFPTFVRTMRDLGAAIELGA